MNISQTTLRIGAVLGTIGAIVLPTASAQAATSRPAGMSQAAYRALVIRSEALNTLYGNAGTRLSPKQFKELYEAGGNRMTPQALVALVTRSEALNHWYGLGRTGHPTQVLEQPGDPRNAFDWGDFGIGAAAMAGFLLLSGGLLFGATFGRKIGVWPRPLS